MKCSSWNDYELETKLTRKVLPLKCLAPTSRTIIGMQQIDSLIQLIEII